MTGESSEVGLTPQLSEVLKQTCVGRGAQEYSPGMVLKTLKRKKVPIPKSGHKLFQSTRS